DCWQVAGVADGVAVAVGVTDTV
ncbi:MAG: hypothetical protein JWM93_2029, partial [Frankiales bacterium]|nr:hypothetical protein [Frankiales bacterium]